MEVDQADAWWLTNGAESDHAEDAEGFQSNYASGLEENAKVFE
jgi:hypothetical protein